MLSKVVHRGALLDVPCLFAVQKGLKSGDGGLFDSINPENVLDKDRLEKIGCEEGIFDGVSTSKLLKSLLVMKLSSYPSLAIHSEKLYNASKRIVGQGLTETILRHTFYGHFVAGETETDLSRVAEQLYTRSNVHTMLCPPMEDLHGQSDNFDSLARFSADRYLQYVDTAHAINARLPGQKSVMQFKLSALFPTQTMVHVSGRFGNNYDHLPELTESYANIMQGSNSCDMVLVG